LALVHYEDGAASELVASRGETSVFAPPAEVGALLAAGVEGCREGPGVLAAPAEVGVLLAAGVLGRPGPAQGEDDINAVDVQEEVDETSLGTTDARLFRGVAARLNYMGPDRPDMQYAIKEAARCMA
jgi:hypothetical protein